MEMELSDGERAALRDELALYLESGREMLGSDGERLVHYPANFDVVADSMNRSDLTSAEEKPWSKYLLSSDRIEDSLDVDGRYRNVLLQEQASETKYVQGIAQIQMYDKQLLSISRRAAQLKASLSASAATAEDDDDDAMSTGRRSDRSSKSLFFLTKGKSEKSSTPRSQSGNSSSPPLMSLNQDSEGEEEKEGGNSPSSRSRIIPASEANPLILTKKRNLIHENIRAVGNPHASLSSAEEYRLQTLLDIDEDGEEWQMLSKFGFSHAQLDHVVELDEQLQRFRPPLDAAYSTSDLAPEGRGGVDDHYYDASADYLVELRLARQQTEYSHKLESMLRSYAVEKADLSGLVDGEERDFRSTRSEVSSFCSSRYQQGSTSMLSLPHPSTVDAKHRVTMREVEDIIAATKSLFLQDSSETSSSSNQDYAALSVPSPHCPQLLQSQLAPRHDIDRLLGSLRFEVQRLAALRDKKRGSGSPQSRGSSSSTPRGSSRGGDALHNGANWQQISPSGSDLEDQMAHMQDLESDILLRFGIPSPRLDDKHVPSHQKLQQQQQQQQHQKKKQQQQQQQQQYFTHASFNAGQDGPNQQLSLPLIKSGPLQTSGPLVQQPQTILGYSPSLPLIAESFRKKVKSLRLRSTRGVIGDPDTDPLDNHTTTPPPPPPGHSIKMLI